MSRRKAWGGQRKGAGRRRVGEQPRVSVPISMPGELRDRLDDLAWSEERSRSDVAREAIELGLREMGQQRSARERRLGEAGLEKGPPCTNE